MSARITRLLGNERGQTLVLFVVILSGLVVLLAFVVDVGAWLGTKHKLQNVADAAALAQVQGGLNQSQVNGDSWATLVCDPSPCFASDSPLEAITVTATRSAPIIFGRIANIGSFDVKAVARAQAQAASSLTNSKLTAVVNSPTSPPPYITPLVVNECAVDSNCPGLVGTCVGVTQQCDLNYDANGAGNSRFGIARFDGTNFHEAVECDPTSQCLRATVSTGATPGQLRSGQVSDNNAVAAMNTAIGRTLILPVFDNFTSGRYHIVGFAAFVITTSLFSSDPVTGNWRPEASMAAACRPNCKVIHGYFTDYTLPASFAASSATAPDFGVRGIGLIQNS